MAGVSEKKRWQFSLGGAMGAMTLVCVTLAASGAIYHEFEGLLALMVFLAGITSAVGVIVGGIIGAVRGAAVGIIVFYVICGLMAIFYVFFTA